MCIRDRSITATVQEGGSLYQAQFAYEQFGEWRGTILRKKLLPDGTVDHDLDTAGNWDASKKIRAQVSRNIWTAMPDVPYMGNWDNFNTDNVDAIEELFGILGYNIQDYHHEGSNCDLRGTAGIETGITDDLKGLINFTNGIDYFDYNGDCNITQKRDHVLGDIYLSLIHI